MNNVKIKGLFKKAAAMVLGITMAFGALALPVGVYTDQFKAASADKFGEYTATVNGCEFTYEMQTVDNVKRLMITGITINGDTGTVKIPESLKVDGFSHYVYGTSDGILKENQQVKTVIFPDTVKIIGSSNFSNSSVENIVLPDGLEELGYGFASGCPNLKSVKYNGTGIKMGKMGSSIFSNSDLTAITNEKGAVCLGNWLIKYTPDDTVTSVKISDLGSNGVKIENIGNSAFEHRSFEYDSNVKTVDLEGIKNIDQFNFNNFKNLTTLLNADEVEYVSGETFRNVAWYSNEKEKDFVRLGKVILYYKTDASSLDLTKGEFAGAKYVSKSALKECENLDTIYCNSDCNFGMNCFFQAYSPRGGTGKIDPVPDNPVRKIKNVYLDGKKLTASMVINDTNAYEWFKRNYNEFEYSPLVKDMIEEKTKDLFDQLDITYYGPDNDKIGTLTPTEEFYIRLKVHNYLSIYDYDYDDEYTGYRLNGGFYGGFLLGGKLRCTSYAQLAHYMQECAGVETKTVFTDPPELLGVHLWNETKIGDEWFMSDDGWDAQDNHSYYWFLNSYYMFNGNPYGMHEFQESYDSYHMYIESKSEENIATERFYGDIDGNGRRKKADLDMLWDYIKGNSSDIDKKAADMNYDGKIDVTDAVLLDRMLYGSTAIDTENIPTDGLAPGIRIAVLNGEDYDNIQYLWTERGGYITLPKLDLEAPEGKKLSYDVGMVGQRVRLTTPYQVIHVKWIDENTPDYSEPDSSIPDSSIPGSRPDPSSRPDSSTPDKKDGILGDVNGDGNIDIEDAVMIVNHINGVKPLTTDEEKRADIDKNSDIDIEDAVAIVAHINGVKPIE